MAVSEAASELAADAVPTPARWHTLASCEKCPAYRETWRGPVTPYCAGAGPERAAIVIVGEAPGEDEALLKQPFVGRSGQLLNEILKMVGLSREYIYVDNASACHPDRNKTPSAKALKACQARLFEEVRQRAPAVILCLGGTALRTFGVDSTITAARGREVWRSSADLAATLHKGRSKREIATLPEAGEWAGGGVYLLPSFHPAYALRNPDVFNDLVEDVRRAAALVGTPPARLRSIPTPIIHVPRSALEAMRWISHLQAQKVIACDIESRSKDYPYPRWREALLTLAYAWREPVDGAIHALVIPSYRGPLIGPKLPHYGWDRGDVHESWQFVGRDIGQRHLVGQALHALHLGDGKRPRCVWWNGKFDRKWYQQAYGWMPRLDGDGMLLHAALDERTGTHGLKERASDDLGADNYEAGLRAYTGPQERYDMGKVPFATLVEYTARDVGLTLQWLEEHDAHARSIEGGDPHHVYKTLLLPAARALSEIEANGIEVDVPALRALDVTFTALLDGYVQTIRDAAGAPTLNPSSQPQMVQVLYGDAVRQQYAIKTQTCEGLPTFGLPVLLNDEGTPGTGADLCDKLLVLHPDAPQAARDLLVALRSYRLDAQLYRTYIRKLPRIVDRQGRVRTNFNLHVARTGRLSSSDPFNLQNIPTRRMEGKAIKRAFRATNAPRVLRAWLRTYAPAAPLTLADEPWVLWEVDMSQAELRVAAEVSGDPIMRAIYAEGRDFHHEVGVQLLGTDDLAKALRPFIKTFNFALLYGAEANKLTQLLNDTALEIESELGTPQRRWTFPEVASLMATFRARFPTFNEWAVGVRARATSTGEVVTWFRRHRRWGLITPQTVNDVHKESVNTLIQSAASDLVLHGLIRTVKGLHHGGWAPLVGRVLLSVHDSIVGESPTSQALAVAQRVKTFLEQIPAEYGMTVPFTADCAIGSSWGALEKVKEPTP